MSPKQIKIITSVATIIRIIRILAFLFAEFPESKSYSNNQIIDLNAMNNGRVKKLKILWNCINGPDPPPYNGKK